MTQNALGDRMKMYEALSAGARHLPRLPVIARLDGRSFSQVTRGLNRPFDRRMSDAMVHTAEFLVDHTHARIGYTQSDEITLVWFGEGIFFDGRIQKMTSALASLATLEFNRQVAETLPEVWERRPVFDCRTWTVPDVHEAVNALLWRELDATKNSVSMAARAHFSHSELHQRDRRQIQDMLHSVGVNWNDYPAFFKRGTYVQHRPVAVEVPVPADAPPSHQGFGQETITTMRSRVRVIPMPPLLKVTNRVDVVFRAADPEVESCEN